MHARKTPDDTDGHGHGPQPPSLGHSSIFQKMHLRLRKRLFTSLHHIRGFARLHKHTLDLTFDQTRLDYLENCLLRDAADKEDVVYFAALLLKVRLQSHILTSRKAKLNFDTIKANVEQAVPQCFLLSSDHSHKCSVDARPASEWASLVQEFFKKKDFNELGAEDARERFLSGIALYQIGFSSYYSLKRVDKKQKYNTGTSGKTNERFAMLTQKHGANIAKVDESESSFSDDDYSDDSERFRAIERRK